MLICKNGRPECIFGHVFEKKKNTSGSISVQIILKDRGKYLVVKTIGSSDNEQQIEKLWHIGKQVERNFKLLLKSKHCLFHF